MTGADPAALVGISGLVRCEQLNREALGERVTEMTHTVYPHDEVFGQFCTVHAHIDCPPAEVFAYMANPFSLLEWTYSVRELRPTETPGLLVGVDAGRTPIYCRTETNAEALTVDYRCAWDQGRELWMVYLNRVVPAQPVLGRPGSVVIWTNCRHPYYDRNPFPELCVDPKREWVGDWWPLFYAGHRIELANLKAILEHRHRAGIPVGPYLIETGDRGCSGGAAVKTVSLMGVASYLPERIVGNDFFAAGAASRRGMFTAPTTRRHVHRDETAVEMIERAATRLVAQLGVDAGRDVDLLFTNVTVPDQPFTGCGAEVAHRLGARPRWVVDLHNTGCVSFIYMIELARALMSSSDARSALLCNVQNAGGRVFAHPEVRLTSQAPVPGDGCGVGFLAASEASPVLSVVHRCNGEFARDMSVAAADGRHYWEPGPSPITVAFSDERVAAIINRGNRVVPEMITEACAAAGVRPRDLALLITNQPNPIFLRNWREALELPPAVHHDTFDRYGNLFGAAIPINLEDALAQGKLAPGRLLGLGGFSHAGDYAAAAVIRWRGGVT